MAIFDPVEQRICIRIVYDGAGGAGKTTNLKALAGLFAAQQATELFSPGEADGRTVYFDWLQIMAGVICGIPLLCQVISVPGQTVMTPRRRHLLASADVVVFVCESDPNGVARAREGLARVAELTDRLPLLVQANKQDQPTALPGSAVAAALGRDATVIEAIATDGVGVIDTFVNAVRLVATAMQDRIDRGDFAIDVGRVAIAQDVLMRLEREILDPTWAAEMLLEEAQAAFLIEGGFDEPARPRPRREAGPPLPRSDVETGFVWPAHSGRAVLDGLGPNAAPVTVGADGVVDLVIGDRRLRTARSLRFEDRELARQALVRSARERAQLDQVLPIDTVLVVQPGRDGSWWLWTVMPNVPTLPAIIDGPRLVEYGQGIAAALRVCLANGFAIDLGPSSFGVHDGTLCYVGMLDSLARETGAEVVRAMDDVAGRGWDSEVFLEAFERELVRLTPEEATRIAGSTGKAGDRSTSRQRFEHALAHIAAGRTIDARAPGAHA